MLQGLALNVDKLIWIGYGTIVTILVYFLVKWFLLSIAKDDSTKTELRCDVFPKIGKTLTFVWGLIVIILLISGIFKHDNKSPDVGATYTKKVIKNYVRPTEKEIKVDNEKSKEVEESTRDNEIKKEQNENLNEFEDFLNQN